MTRKIASDTLGSFKTIQLQEQPREECVQDHRVQRNY